MHLERGEKYTKIFIIFYRKVPAEAKLEANQFAVYGLIGVRELKCALLFRLDGGCGWTFPLPAQRPQLGLPMR